MKKIKLSIPQRALLGEILERPKYVDGYYLPAVCLVKHGLAKWTSESVLAVTEAGLRFVETEIE